MYENGLEIIGHCLCFQSQLMGKMYSLLFEPTVILPSEQPA